jgi:hypothetical protein
MLFEPLDAFGVEVVGRLVEQQDVGFWSSSRVSATRRFSPPDRLVDRGVARRAAQRVHRDLELVVERPAVDRVDLLLELAHLGHQRVEIGVVPGDRPSAEMALKRSIMSATSRTPSLTFSSTVLVGSSCGSCSR